MDAHIGKGMVAGFAATVVLSAFMIAKAAMGLLPAMNAIRMLAMMAHGYAGLPAAPAVGWVMHFSIGTIAWGILFALLFSRIPGKSALAKGLTFSTGAWLLMMVMVMPLAGVGLFGLRLGIGPAVATLVLHWIFGAVLGPLYGRLTCASAAAPEYAQG